MPTGRGVPAKTALVCATVAVVALLAWFLWPPAAVEPRPMEGGVVQGPSAPAPSATDSRQSQPADVAPEHLRRSVDRPTGPTGARVTCVWANDSEPAAAMAVRVYRIEHRLHVGPVATAATDATGVVTFTDLAAGEHAFHAARAKVRATIVPGVLVETKLTLEELAVVRGIVVDTADAPVAAAKISAEIAGYPQAIAMTGVDGRFRVRLASRGRIWANKEGHGPSRLHRVAGDTEDLVLQLEVAGGSINGVVLDPDGRGVAHATVAVAIDLGTGGGRPKRPAVLLETDAHGEFATAQVPRGKLIVYAHRNDFGFGRQDVDTAGPGAARIVVRLRRAASIHGIFLGGENGDEPLAGGTINVHRQRYLAGLLIGTSCRLTRFNTVTNSAGRYRLTGLPPGRMWIMATVAKRPPLYHNVLLREGEDCEWSPDLSRPSGVIRGVLQAPDGEPLAGWQVIAIHVDLIEMKQERAVAETNADGRFELVELSPNPHTLTVSTSEHGAVIAKRTEVSPGKPAFVWRLTGLPSQSGAIVGRVLGPDGETVADAKLRANSEGISRSGSQLSDSEDGFRIEGVLPGTWDVIGQLDGYGSFELGRHQAAATATVRVGPHRLLLRGAAIVHVAGRGYHPAGIRLALELVESGKNKTSEFTVDEGGLRSPPLPPGRYRLRARGENFALSAREVTIPPGDAVAVDLEVERAIPVAIEFVPEELDGSDWHDYLRIKLRNAGGEVVFTHGQNVRGAPTATFTIGLAAGAYTIEGSSPNLAYRRGSTPFVVPSDTTGRRDVRVLLEVQKR